MKIHLLKDGICAFLAIIIFLLVPSFPTSAKESQKYKSIYQTTYNLAATATANSAIQFTISGTGIMGGLKTDDVEIKIVKGSGLNSSMIAGETLRKTRLPNGDLFVTIVGDIRSVFPTSPNKTAKFEISIIKAGVKTLKIERPRWGDVAPARDSEFAAFDPGAATLTGAKFVLDPTYVAFNDSEVPIEIRNLQLLSNISAAAFEALDISAIFDAPFDFGLPHFNLSPSTSSSDLGLIFDFSAEPDPGNYLVAMGQIFDPVTGAVESSFIQGVQAAPEPGTVLLLIAALIGFGLGNFGGNGDRRDVLRFSMS